VSAAHIGLILLAVTLFPTRNAVAASELKDLHFGEALYHAYQEHYFEALERLDAEIAQHRRVDERELDSLYAHFDHAEFSVGDFELSYRMHHRAGRAITAVLEGDVDEPVRNEAAYRLARIHFQKDQPYAALHALDGISGRLPENIREDAEFLRANVYMAIGRSSDAVEVLRRLQDSPALKAFSTYNLGIALLQDGRAQEALQQLDRAGRVKADDHATRAIRDKSNLVLGTLLFESAAFGPAQRSLERVRIEGPFSNQALLRAGWADASAEKFERALVPWGVLAEREATDPAVQEAMLALPYAYSKLNVHGRAAVLYERAVESFGTELERVDASIDSIQEGQFLKALVRAEIRQDKDYLDLEDLRKKLVSWQTSLDSFEDVIRLRQEYYEPLLPDIARQFRKLDAQVRLRLEQRKYLAQRLEQMLIAPRPDFLATADERLLGSRIDRLDAGLAKHPDEAALRLRIQRLKGVLTWGLETQYHQRLTDAHEHLRELDEHVDALTAQYDAFVRARQAATHSYVGYAIPITRLRVRVGDALERLDVLMARQGHLLEVVAIEELTQRRERLVTYQDQARFAFADSYDRAAKAQAR
jgi:tetratricopeptide (TPR) repeat protein